MSDAKEVGTSELRGVDDHEVFAAAVSETRTIVTENVKARANSVSQQAAVRATVTS